MKNKRNIYKILQKDKNVNNYTKLLLYLNIIDYYGDNYIPNRKLMNYLKLTKAWIIELLHQLEKNKVITLFYKGRKRYFTFNEDIKDDQPVIIEEENDDYNWLDDQDWS